MASNIDIDYDLVEGTVAKVKGTIADNQSNCSSIYQAISNLFIDSSGETAAAIRELQTAEQSLAEEFCNILTQLYDCIQSAANEFAAFDAKMNATMAAGGVHMSGNGVEHNGGGSRRRG